MKKVVVAMSGGVDSSVAAYLLKEDGYDVIGITMQIWQNEDMAEVENRGGCCGQTAVEDARFVCNKLNIPHYTLNFRDIFKKRVIDYFAKEYLNGRTPNPCIACNRYVKWQNLLSRASALGANYIATGHYAKIIKKAGRLTICQADSTKDQSYALYNLSQEQLGQTLFPIGCLSKDEVRKIAAEKIGLRVANKPDSQEICFIQDNNHPLFLEKYLGKTVPTGDFLDESGAVLGRHKGITHYTIGQRKGLGIAFGCPMYVKEINASSNAVILSTNDKLFSRLAVVEDLNFMLKKEFIGELRCFGKIRYTHKAAPCVIVHKNNVIECCFDEAQRAITPGQAAVFYDNEGNIICGGTIRY